MRGIRIQPTLKGKFLIDVVCNCGANGLTDAATGEASFRHSIELDTAETKVLLCGGCKSQYLLRPQVDHIHIDDRSNLPLVADRILFYEGSGYCFSNFSSFRVIWRNIDWMTSEHAYQAAKFENPEIVDLIRNARSAYDAKKIAHEFRDKEISNWAKIKIAVMKEIVRAKLEQHPYIQKKLLESGHREIIENSPTDSFWGRGPDWQGQNWLGRVWMMLRAELRVK